MKKNKKIKPVIAWAVVDVDNTILTRQVGISEVYAIFLYSDEAKFHLDRGTRKIIKVKITPL